MKFLFVAILSIMILTACGAAKKESKTTEYNETLVETENITVVLESISTVIDEEWDTAYHQINLNIENKSDQTVDFGANDVKIDGLDMTRNVFFTEELASGESVQTDIVIQFYKEEIQPLEKQLEFTLVGLETEKYSRIVEEKIVVSIK